MNVKTKKLWFILISVNVLSSCSSSDIGSDEKTLGNLSIGVSLPSATSRVIEVADTKAGLITTWENKDELSVFHQYVEAGTTIPMQGFNFENVSSSGTNAVFVYRGSNYGYSFNSGKKMYAFNRLPIANNYIKAYNSSSDDFVLNLSGFDSQNGTVGCLRNYDAMYGVSSVESNGTPENIAMKHYSAVIRFDLSNPAFTDSLEKVIFTCGSAGTSILPSSAGFTLNKDGMITNEVLKGNTSWSVSNVAASSGTASVYLMTFPFQNMNGTLTITATNSVGNTYSRQITLSNFSLTSGNVKAYKVTLNSTGQLFALKYYMWDASAEYVSGTTNYNMATSGGAAKSCVECPTYDQIQMYLGAGVYWDKATKWKDTVTGTAYTGGLWLKKKATINGFDTGQATKTAWATVNLGTPSNIADYFFLPASGYKYSNSAGGQGTVGRYWSSTLCSDGYKAYRLYFDNNGAFVSDDTRPSGYCLWSVE